MKKYPHIADIPGLTLAQIMEHPLYDNATDAEIAYSANVSIDEVRAARRHLAQRRTA